MLDIKKHLIQSGDTLKSALIKLNSVPNNLTLFVLDENQKLVGSLTDGDIRRGLIEGKSVEESVESFMKRDFSYLTPKQNKFTEIKSIKLKGVKLLPVLDDSGRILRVIDLNSTETILPVDAILMAGGRGERLRPFTDDIPKSLLNVGGKPILEHNIDRLIRYGVQDYTITIRYLGEKIEEYFGCGATKGVSIKYIKEEEPLGTIGAVGLVQEFRNDNILIMNSDLFTNIDFEDFYQTFCDEDADVCIATIPYNVDIPYAVLGFDNQSVIRSLTEKPSYTYYANAGIYLVKKSMLKRIPKSVKTDATDFIIDLINDNCKVTRYPIIGFWIDIGKPEDLNKAKDFARHLKF